MQETLYQSKILTPLGPMNLYASEQGIRYLFFGDSHKNKYIYNTLNNNKVNVLDKENEHMLRTKKYLKEYFNQERQEFDVPLDLKGTDFQIAVWNSLLKIPFGKTYSYLQQAKVINNPKAVRAVASANGRNPISIMIPCHRVIGSNGKLTGYAGGMNRKAYLLQLENPNPKLDF